MKVSISSNPAQSRQVKQRLANPNDSLSYELGKAVQELPPFYTRLLTGGISLLVFGTIAWAHFSKVDEVAVANGKLIPSTEVRPVRAPSVGSIREVRVKEGDLVRRNTILVEIDPGTTETNVESMEKDAEKIREDIARLEAERQGVAGSGTPLQNQLLIARQQEFNEKQAAAIAEANRQEATIQEGQARLQRLQENLINARTNLKNAQSNLEIAEERVKSLSTLLTDGAFPRLEYLQAQEQATNSRNQVTEAEDRIVSIEKEIDAQQERIQQSREAYQAAQSTASGLAPQRQSEILTQLTQRRQELTKKLGEIAVAKQQKKERETITAPFDGTIYNLKATKGIVQQGEELLSVLPEGEDLVLEVKILNRDIGFIRKDMRAKVKLATFPYQEFGIVDGEVLKVSPDAVIEKDENGRELGLVYPTRIRLKQHEIMVRGEPVKLTAGMSATAEIVTRQKSVLTLLIEPVTRRFNEAFSVR
jgi:HlyD family secretion protein